MSLKWTNTYCIAIFYAKVRNRSIVTNLGTILGKAFDQIIISLRSNCLTCTNKPRCARAAAANNSRADSMRAHCRRNGLAGPTGCTVGHVPRGDVFVNCLEFNRDRYIFCCKLTIKTISQSHHHHWLALLPGYLVSQYVFLLHNHH